MSNTVTIYHNPRCSKSRQSLALLQENGIEPVVVEYLKNPLDSKAIKSLLKKLNLPLLDVVRRNESVFKSLNIDSNDENAIINAIVANPILLQRPIIVKGSKAVIGRPPENIYDLTD